jgi:uncharacterized damage-inducible protein DinB
MLVTKKTLDQVWDQLRQKYGVYLRLLESLPDEALHANPIVGMRTPTQLAVHASGTVVRDIAKGVAKGRIEGPVTPESKTAAALKTKEDLIGYARACWEEADAAVAKIGDAELAAIVPTPWNMSFPGGVAFGIINDEFVHHRGQLYAFARATGAEPPFLWSHGENAPEFAPS